MAQGVSPVVAYPMAVPRSPLAVTTFLAALVVAVQACESTPVVPPDLEPRIDRELTFATLKAAPEANVGHLVVLGGEVLGARLMKDGTRIEVLHLPLQSNQEPVTDRMASEGRFLAVQPDFLDPATLPPGTRLTLVGEVSGATTLPLDDTEYTYPLVTIKSFRTWPAVGAAQYRYGASPYLGPSYWGPYWNPFWPRYPYWW